MRARSERRIVDGAMADDTTQPGPRPADEPEGTPPESPEAAKSPETPEAPEAALPSERTGSSRGEEPEVFDLEPLDEGPARAERPDAEAKAKAEEAARAADDGDAARVPDELNLLDESCPNCGSPMTEPDQIVCLRCGFDLARLKVVETATGVEEVDPDAPAEPGEGEEGEAEAVERRRGPALARDGRGGIMLPLIVAAACVFVLSIAAMVGWSGLYPTEDGLFLDAQDRFSLAAPLFADRFARLLRLWVGTVLFAGAIWGALELLGWVEKRPVGPTRLVFARTLGIAAACEVAWLLEVPLGEWFVQLLVMATAFLLLTRAFFRVDWRQAATAGAVTLVAFGAIVLVAEVVALVV